ncbi:MAG: alpha/beta fold hydrolase [Hyphomicrobiaceae bacterium]
MMPPRIDTVIQLSDKRNLSYAEYGAADGFPVFLFHGLPGSRLSWGLIPNDPFPPGMRIIAPERPGYGNSDPKPNRTLLDWAEDVVALADALEIGKFAAVGVSGGGPGALACAWTMPERLMAVGVVAAPAPTNAPGVLGGMSKTNRFFMKLAWHWPWLSSLNIRFLAFFIRSNPARYIRTMQYKLHNVDKRVLARPEIQQMLTKDFTEALHRGWEGMVSDLSVNHGQSWGFALNEIKARVHFWYCELDRSVPPAMGQYLCSAIPNSDLRLVPNAGHLWILEHLRDVLDAVLSDEPDGNKMGNTTTKHRA